MARRWIQVQYRTHARIHVTKAWVDPMRRLEMHAARRRGRWAGLRLRLGLELAVEQVRVAAALPHQLGVTGTQMARISPVLGS